MYKKGHYLGKSETEIQNLVQEEGFSPIKISDSPGFVYPSHNHPETKLLAILSGSMTAKVGEEEYFLNPGDQILIPGKLTHSAVVGRGGCTFFWSEKMI